MASISSTGLGSGLDIGSIVGNLIAAEKTPVTNRLDKRESKLQSELSALGVFKSSLSEVRTAALNASLASTFKSKTATSANNDLFTATASYSTKVASYNIQVNRLAQSHSLELANQVNKDAKFNDGTLKISIGDGSSHDVKIDSSNNTLEGIAKAINGTANVGVSATILSNGNDRQLVLKSSKTGEANTIKIEVNGSDESGKLSLARNFSYGTNLPAQNHSLQMGAAVNKDATFNTGKLSISVGSGDVHEVEIGAGKTLEGIAAAINDTENVGVTARVISEGSNRRLVLESSIAGAENKIKVAVAGTDQAGQLSLADSFTHDPAVATWAHSLKQATAVNKDATFNPGTLKISVGAGSSHDVIVAEGSNTLEDIAAAINATDGIGVRAEITKDGDNRQLVLKSAASTSQDKIKLEVASETAIGGLSLADHFAYDPNPPAVPHAVQLAAPVNKDGQFNAGTLTISIGAAASHDVSIGSNQTLEDIAAAINGTSEIGVTAEIVSDGDNRQLILRSSLSGEAGTIKVEVSGDDEDGKLSLASNFAYSGSGGTGMQDLPSATAAMQDLGVQQVGMQDLPPGASGMQQVQAAQDASITIDGSTTETTSATDTFSFTSGAMAGIGLTIKKVGSDNAASTAKLTIGLNTESALEAVGAFVKGINNLGETTKSLTSYDVKTKAAGALLGDAGVRAVSSQIKKLLGDSIITSSPFKNLSSVGIETQRDGTLKLDTNKLKAALEQDPTGVSELFLGVEASDTTRGFEGVGDRFKNYLDKILDSKSSLSSRTDTLNKNILRVADDRVTLQNRIDKLELRYMKQFSAMDSLVGRMTSMGNFLTQQFDMMANMYKSGK